MKKVGPWVVMSSYEAGKFYRVALAALGPCNEEGKAQEFYLLRREVLSTEEIPLYDFVAPHFRANTAGSFQNYRKWCKRMGKG